MWCETPASALQSSYMSSGKMIPRSASSFHKDDFRLISDHEHKDRISAKEVFIPAPCLALSLGLELKDIRAARKQPHNQIISHILYQDPPRIEAWLFYVISNASATSSLDNNPVTQATPHPPKHM